MLVRPRRRWSGVLLTAYHRRARPPSEASGTSKRSYSPAADLVDQVGAAPPPAYASPPPQFAGTASISRRRASSSARPPGPDPL